MNKTKHTITFKIFEADVPNKNGRIYSREVLEKIVEQANKIEKEQGFIMGQFIQDLIPYGPVPACQQKPSTLDLNNVTHKVTNVRMENSDLVGDVTPMSTPKGLILNSVFTELIDTISPEAPREYFEVVSRGIGRVGEDGTVSDYSLIAIDIDPIPVNPEQFIRDVKNINVK